MVHIRSKMIVWVTRSLITTCNDTYRFIDCSPYCTGKDCIDIKLLARPTSAFSSCSPLPSTLSVRQMRNISRICQPFKETSRNNIVFANGFKLNVSDVVQPTHYANVTSPRQLVSRKLKAYTLPFYIGKILSLEFGTLSQKTCLV